LAEAAKQHGLTELVLSGGGSANQTALRWLREAVPGVRVLTTTDLGVPVQAKEAVAFALLGFLIWNGLPRVGDRGDRRCLSGDSRHHPAGRYPAEAARASWGAAAVPAFPLARS
jgi:1,6-anhydro-N-acetylmuramate kinase